jgi:hypothetical protein
MTTAAARKRQDQIEEQEASAASAGWNNGITGRPRELGHSPHISAHEKAAYDAAYAEGAAERKSWK